MIDLSLVEKLLVDNIQFILLAAKAYSDSSKLNYDKQNLLRIRIFYIGTVFMLGFILYFFRMYEIAYDENPKNPSGYIVLIYNFLTVFAGYELARFILARFVVKTIDKNQKYTAELFNICISVFVSLIFYVAGLVLLIKVT